MILYDIGWVIFNANVPLAISMNFTSEIGWCQIKLFLAYKIPYSKELWLEEHTYLSTTTILVLNLTTAEIEGVFPSFAKSTVHLMKNADLQINTFAASWSGVRAPSTLLLYYSHEINVWHRHKIFFFSSEILSMLCPHII